MGVVPSDDELTSAVRSVRSNNPALGIHKILATVLSTEPTWSVSEKRLRKVLQKLKGDEYPTSALNTALDVAKYSDRVRPVVFGPEKGKGLVAAQDIGVGEVLWREDPFVYAPPWEIYEAQQAGTACPYCARAFTPTTPPLRVQCPHASSSSSATCRATFCSRLCLTRSGITHSLLCPVANPACDHLLDFLKERKWKAALAFTKCVVRILDAWQDKGPGAAKEDGYMDKNAILTTYKSFATLRSDKRWTHTSENDLARSANEKLFAAMQTGLVQAFYIPSTDDSKIPLVPRSPTREKALRKLLKTPVPPDVLVSLFSKDGVLEGLGKMSLNLESHGGLFPLHSHLNHSCTPTLSVRHIPGDIHGPNPSRITLVTVKEIKQGDEVVISYVDPSQGVKDRRRKLREWDFGECLCERCVREDKEGEGEGKAKEGLEDEIRGFLGV